MADSQTFQNLKPSASTVASAVGGFLASFAIWASKAFGGVEIPADLAAQLAVAVTLLAGYFFAGGRSNDTV